MINPVMSLDSFFKKFEENPEGFKDILRKEGVYDFFSAVKKLLRFSRAFNMNMSKYIFGERLGEHIFEKFLRAERDLLVLLTSMDTNTGFYLVFKILKDPNIYANK